MKLTIFFAERKKRLEVVQVFNLSNRRITFNDQIDDLNLLLINEFKPFSL